MGPCGRCAIAATSHYIVVGSRPWSRRAFDELYPILSGTWRFIASPEELTLESLAKLAPRYVFFLHWSWKVPPQITSAYECIGFHMTDVPYGRGGSPLQNLIVRGHRNTKLTALRMVDEMDAGPVYLKEDLSLEGRAEDIYLRASHLSMNMALRIVQEAIEPTPQTDKPTIFNRRRPSESDVTTVGTLPQLYDFIRMLDADGYPHAFLDSGAFRYEFRYADLREDKIVAQVTITPGSSRGR